ncbi:endonuclease/exonuclease/phosphatase family protein [Culicoidibacter larvae]|uniref:Endonuclease/exonuclease/phosphatase domain-containing protein n=1 Tax=Culicoidibacter larvae TaxID=2579976 RepID=A0A5R8QHG2_9FIRM|nr:endonuclease/exonuclease/phosphatase family protein [Culicoidibacter larvae]TLG77402.1 hypothetical protein FEZ08_01925 [Culicoidibacter larvae]
MKRFFKIVSSSIVAIALLFITLPQFPVTAAFTAIHDIQGTTHTSPLVGQTVSVQGVVTSLDVNKGLQGFYIQAKSVDEDNDPRTAEGIYVKLASPITSGWTTKEGNFVEVDGIVAELPAATYSGSAAAELTQTAISSATIVSTDSGDYLDEVSIQLLGDGGLTIPHQTVKNGSMSDDLDITSAMDFFEALEGMRVQVNDPQLVAPPSYDTYNVTVQSPGGQLKSANGGIIATPDSSHYDILNLQVPYAFSNQAGMSNMLGQTGDTINGSLTGVMTYNYTQYKIFLDYNQFNSSTKTFKPEVATFNEKNIQQMVTSLSSSNDVLTVAAFNVENYSAMPNKTSDEKSLQVAKGIVTNLGAPDIVSLEEIQDNSGNNKGDGTSAADQSIQRLLDDIIAVGGPNYQALNIDPEFNQDGGATNGNIRVVILYNPDRVEALNVQAGDHTTAATIQDTDGEAMLVQNPARIGVGSTNFISTRKSLVGQFRFNDEVVTVIGNHFSSKGGDEGMFGINQPPTLHSETKRIEQAREVNAFVQSMLAINPDAHIVVLGDMNDYEFTPVLQTLSGNELTNMTNSLPAETRYSYLYQGRQQTLDHILVNSKHLAQTQIEAIHMNADFTVKNGQVSDHDPMIISMQVKANDIEDSSNNNTDKTTENQTGSNSNSNLPQTGGTPAETIIVGIIIVALGTTVWFKTRKSE